jgi:hypothetical protein
MVAAAESTRVMLASVPIWYAEIVIEAVLTTQAVSPVTTTQHAAVPWSCTLELTGSGTSSPVRL